MCDLIGIGFPYGYDRKSGIDIRAHPGHPGCRRHHCNQRTGRYPYRAHSRCYLCRNTGMRPSAEPGGCGNVQPRNEPLLSPVILTQNNYSSSHINPWPLTNRTTSSPISAADSRRNTRSLSKRSNVNCAPGNRYFNSLTMNCACSHSTTFVRKIVTIVFPSKEGLLYTLFM